MDTQTIELVGQHRLASELLLAGLEVAFPARDRGVDLIAYAEVGRGLGGFVARPIQMKVASRRSFGIWKKYEKIHGLILAFVWHLDGQGERDGVDADRVLEGRRLQHEQPREEGVRAACARHAIVITCSTAS